jgi:hypothetical protein
MMKHVTCVLVNEIPGVRVGVKEIANKGQETFFPLVNPALLYRMKNFRLELVVALLFGRLTVSLDSKHFETKANREYSVLLSVISFLKFTHLYVFEIV